MEIQFGDKVMKTAVYIKMDAHDQLLLSEGVCRQLGIITYHSDVNVTHGSKKHIEGKITTVRVKLMQSVQLLPHQSLKVDLQLDKQSPTAIGNEDMVLLEPDMKLKETAGVTLEDALLSPNADALSRNPLPNLPDKSETVGEGEVQVAAVCSTVGDGSQITSLLSTDDIVSPGKSVEPTFGAQQRRDEDLSQFILFLEHGKLPDDEVLSKKIVAQATQFVIVDEVLYFVHPRRSFKKRAAVPKHLRQSLMEEHHRGSMGGHFAANKLYRTLASHWWWEGMYTGVFNYVKSCPECAIISGTGRKHRPPLHPIPVQRPFQILGVDIMELPITKQGNRYSIVFQDFFPNGPGFFRH